MTYVVLYPREEIPHSPNGPSELPVLLEVDGSPHYFWNEPMRPRGETILKHRLLRELSAGEFCDHHQGEEWWSHVCHRWAAFVSVAHYEWPWGPNRHGDRRDLLETKLREQGLDPTRFIAGHKGRRRRRWTTPRQAQDGEGVDVEGNTQEMEVEHEEGMTSLFGRSM